MNRILLLLILSAQLGSSTPCAGNELPSSPDAATAANLALPWVIQNGSMQSLAPSKKVRLGVGLPYSTVSSRQLDQWKRGDDIYALIAAPEKILYAIYDSSGICAGLELVWNNQCWMLGGWTSFNQYDPERDRCVKATGLHQEDFILVHFAGETGETCLGYRLKSQLYLVPLFGWKGSGLEPGKAEPAEKVLELLQVYARKRRANPNFH